MEDLEQVYFDISQSDDRPTSGVVGLRKIVSKRCQNRPSIAVGNCQLLDEVEQKIVICGGELINYLPMPKGA